MARNSGARGSNEGPRSSGARGSADGPRSSGMGARDDEHFVIPIFAKYDYDLPRWKPYSMSKTEWTLIMCFCDRLPSGMDSYYRTSLLELGPRIQEDETNPYVRESRSLSYYTRWLDRDREQKGIPRLSDAEGFLPWNRIEIENQHFRIMDPVHLAVLIARNNKGRFECQIRTTHRSSGGDRAWEPQLFIRAVQGHGFALDPNLLFTTKIDLAQARDLGPVVHGTKLKVYQDYISTQGLVPGGGSRGHRQAVHFMAMGWHQINPNGPFSSLRSNSEIFIIFDLEAWVAGAGDAYLSPNGVVNVFRTIPTMYFAFTMEASGASPRSPIDWIAWWAEFNYNESEDSEDIDGFNAAYAAE